MSVGGTPAHELDEFRDSEGVGAPVIVFAPRDRVTGMAALEVVAPLIPEPDLAAGPVAEVLQPALGADHGVVAPVVRA